MGKMGRPRHPDILTPREWEVLGLLRERLTNEEIAQRLNISLDGAKYHVSRILSKLGVTSREEAAAWPPEERRWWARWPVWAKIAGAATLVGAAATGLVVAFSGGGSTVTLESGVFADDALTRVATRPAIGRTSLPSNLDASPTPTPTSPSSPSPTSSLVVVGPTTIDVSKLPTPAPTQTSLPTETPGATVTATATPASCETECSGIQGTVVIGVCSVEAYPPQEECYPPFQATVFIWNADRTQQLAAFTSDEQGQFRAPLRAGEYYIDPQGAAGAFGAPQARLVTVPTGRFIEMTLIYDSGMQ
jgi:DNA-binding CsgD family transcriptional regulator